MSHVLIVEDNVDSAEMMAALIATEDFTVAVANSLRDARRQLALHPPDVVLLDLKLPDGSGMELFDDPKLLENSEVVLITGHASLETSIQAFRLGAADYLIKPVTMKQLQGILSRVMRPGALKVELATLREEWERSGRFGHLWGRSPAMRRVYEQISRVAATAVTVFITGESGTGKEMVARTVHDLSRRRSQPFLAVNCGAISPNLIESEILGHEKGSFTGADRQHLGFFERAHGGTLFLDEITEMPLELQVKLLRVLETGTLMRVGSTQSQEIDVRVIAATNRPPHEAVAAHSMREDLLYRLNVFPIDLPPLRERVDDIALLAEQFLADICQREGQAKRFSAAALAHLATYRWPGNVRELRNVVQRAYLMAADEIITDEWLPSDAPAALTPPGGPTPSDPSGSITVRLGTTLAEAEYQLILATLQHFNNHKERTAAVLGVSLKTLYNRLKEYAGNKAGSAEAAMDEALAGPPAQGLPDSCLAAADGQPPLRQPERRAARETAWTPGKSTTPNIG
ncbi:MAG TPA: sigma-54 dependent transcriptional regulator [Azonexus sp.]|nr:sigma-54 dependent transcriptional regulator [Azonexus sp.]